MSEILDIINEEDEVIGQASRFQAHQEGLLHRVIHVLFYTPDGHIIFQRRHPSKKTGSNKLTATVGGHVESGQTYLQTAVKETLEETGMRISPEDIVFIGENRSNVHDDATGKINNVLRHVYAYKFLGKVEDLKIEDGEGVGFESRLLHEMVSLSDEGYKEFVVFCSNPGYKDFFRKILEMLHV